MGDERSAASTTARGHQPAIAIVGMSGRFPGARDLRALWTHLSQGLDSVTEVPRERWALDTPDGASSAHRGGFLDEVDRFDPGFFGLSRQEAARMDPQQRLVLEHCWQALEDAGHPAPVREGRGAGVFMGMRPSDYPESASLFTGNDSSLLLARVSRLLGIQGAGLVVDAACASSLVAIHLACQQLRTGGLEWALAGGVFVMNTPRFHRMAAQAGMLSAQGRCRPFSPEADGFVPAEGVGVVMLKPLERALADGDRILGLIRGSDSAQSARLPGAPTSHDAQARADLLRAVHQQAGVEPETLSYVEAHGSGSRHEDEVELEALRQVFQARTPRTGSRVLGSIKGNLGHAVSAAGVAGVLKILLAFEHRQLPPSLGNGVPPGLEETSLQFNTRALPWTGEEGTPRRAAISAFSFSGTDCHLVLEEAPRPLPRASVPERPAYLFVLSARTDEALVQMAANLLERLGHVLSHGEGPHPGDVAFTLARGREVMEKRAAFVASDLSELSSAPDALPGHPRGTAPRGPGAALRLLQAPVG